MQAWFFYLNVIDSHFILIKSTPPNQANKTGLNVHASVNPSIHKKLYDLSEIWYVRRRQWLIQDSMPYDLMQVQGQGHRGPKGAKLVDFKGYLLHRYACNQKTNGELWYS